MIVLEPVAGEGRPQGSPLQSMVFVGATFMVALASTHQRPCLPSQFKTRGSR
jgi:hypothetical protein